MPYWLIKSEPSDYSYDDLVRDGRAAWTGIRNFEARNNLRAMKLGDLALYYLTGDVKAVVGIAKILGAAGPDPTAAGEDWAAVDVAPHQKLKAPVTLAQIKKDKALKDFQLVTRGRLSVVPARPEHFKRVLALAKAR